MLQECGPLLGDLQWSHLIIWPCPSARPFCQASVESLGSISCFCKQVNHWSARNSPAGSEHMARGWPAQENQKSVKAGDTCSRCRFSSWRPSWNIEASSMQWKIMTWKALRPVQKNHQPLPLQIRCSVESWSLAGRLCLNLLVSTHASQTNSLASSAMWSSAPFSSFWVMS